MSRSLLKLSQSYANGEMDEVDYRKLRREAIEENLAGGDDQTKPGLAGKSAQAAVAPSKPQQPAEPSVVTLLPALDNSLLPAIPFSLGEKRYRLNAVVPLLLVVVMVGAVAAVAFKPAVEVIEAALTVRFNEISADGEIELGEDEDFFELWDLSTPQAQQQWVALVKEEQSRNANSTDDSWMARSENIDSILEEIENQSVDNASDQQFDQTPAVAEPLAVIQEPVKEAVKAIPPPAKPTENKPAVQKQAEVTVAVVEEKAEEKVEEKAEERVEKKIGQSNDKPVVKVIKQTAVVVKPKPKPKPEPVPKAAASPADKHQGMSVAKPTYHKVTAGENLFGLSTKYNVVTDALILMNPGIEAGLKADSKVIVAGIVKHKVARGDTLTGIANHYKTTIEQLKQFNPGIDKKLMAGAKVTIKKVIISDKKAKPDSAQGLTDAFKRLAADQVLTVGNLKTFFSEWKKSNTAAKRQLLDFAEFAGLNERLQKEVSDMKQGLKVRNSTEERWIRKVAKKFAYVK